MILLVVAPIKCTVRPGTRSDRRRYWRWRGVGWLRVLLAVRVTLLWKPFGRRLLWNNRRYCRIHCCLTTKAVSPLDPSKQQARIFVRLVPCFSTLRDPAKIRLCRMYYSTYSTSYAVRTKRSRGVKKRPPTKLDSHGNGSFVGRSVSDVRPFSGCPFVLSSAGFLLCCWMSSNVLG